VSPQASAPDNLAIRLTFSYEDRTITIQSRQHLRMKAPPTDQIDEYENHSGAWVELRDDKQRVLYRKVLHSLVPSEIEAPSGDPTRTFTRVPARSGKGVFSIVVPDLPQTARVLLYDSPARDEDRPSKEPPTARRIAEFDLKSDAKDTR
jgi:hypothetical protein